MTPRAHSHVPEHSHGGKNPHSGHQTANNTLHAPFASEVMSFLSILRVGLSSSWQKGSQIILLLRQLLLPSSFRQQYIHYAQAGNQNPLKNNFPWKLKDPLLPRAFISSHSSSGSIKAKLCHRNDCGVYISRSIYLISLGNYRRVKNALWWEGTQVRGHWRRGQCASGQGEPPVGQGCFSPAPSAQYCRAWALVALAHLSSQGPARPREPQQWFPSHSQAGRFSFCMCVVKILHNVSSILLNV